MQHVRIDDVPWESQRSPSGKFASSSRNLSVALGGRRNVGTWGGGHPFDLQIRRIPAGAAVCPFHSHLAQWELFVVLRGGGTVRSNDETHEVAAGDVFFHPPGVAHQLRNAADGELEVLIIADNPPLDAFFYPDSRKWGLRPPGVYFHLDPIDYFEGEDTASAPGHVYVPSPNPPPLAIAPFAQRRVRVDALPWEAWSSPQGRFRGSSRELSIALGAKRGTPIGLGGHPFDLELSRLAPGETGCPYHSHAAQWELFWIISGTAAVRTPEGTRQIGPGEIVLHPPGEAHQITSTSTTEDLLFYLVADNPPVDYWHYPDSGKWGLAEPRMFFRPSVVEYYEGEE
jgi:uncharacterized cupin superfamily protein